MQYKGGFLCVKQDMSSLNIDGKVVPVTFLKYLDQEIIRFKTTEKDGYNAIVVGVLKEGNDGEKKEYRYVREFKVDNLDGYEIGQKIDVSELLNGENVYLTLKGKTKGKGFQGVVKRYGFAGGPASHGSKFHRHPGGIGNRKPRRVNKNHPLPGHMGDENVTLKNVKVIGYHDIDGEKVVIVKGSVMGSRNSLIKALVQ